MIKIFRKEGWGLNPNDKVVNGILRLVEKSNGHCPCATNKGATCPCDSYLHQDKCHCNLYIKMNT